VRGWVIASSDSQRINAGGKLIRECHRHALLDNHPRRSGAGFTFVVEASFERVSNGTVDVRVVEHQERVFPPSSSSAGAM